MLTINQRLILGFLLLLGLLIGIGIHGSIALRQAVAVQQNPEPPVLMNGARDRLIQHDRNMVEAAIAAGVLIATGFFFWIIRPIRHVASTARLIREGHFTQRAEWRAKGDLGAIASEINRMAVQLRDLRDTESGRKQMEHQLSDAVVQSIFEPVIVTDANGHVLKLNQAAVDVLGDVAGDRMALANTPGGEKILQAVHEAVSMQRSNANQGEASLLPMKIGQGRRVYRLRTTPMRTSDGNLLGAVSVLEDISEMQDLDRFKTKFLAVASQKLREPLENLRLGVHALTHGFAGEMQPLQNDLIRGAEEEAGRLDELMRDLIEVSEIQNGTRQIEITRIRPIDILRDAHNRHADEARKKNIEVEIQAYDDLSYVNGDRRAIRGILDNLLSNALRHTPEGGSIVLEAQEHKDKVQFFVRDSGRGIEAERLPTIFGRFNTAEDGGTGLGLALVHRLVELLGGQAAVESRLGHGTTFSFTLPVATSTTTRHPIEIG